ncbi:adenosylmethionine--8-amino-7-oxononanoate transaminase [Bradyrhizobium sp. WSM471]|uniref:adenosylmethionine--8-amino-7-oxononanoate transaminase n=1 Tax=Bradyrhizobium sp. WSM471 TaxID=319017 RepID=UPI0005692240|nr:MULTISPECIES: adenosylmethionine--8-amino-7-oxononanoate transaminase [Bradyrhizobium]UFW44932.1 adenosylmethionine--8-amino-7-oxononanoate transaminase [Bradyrhizobium canariense]
MKQRKTSPIWHPFTQHALEGKMSKVVRGDGAYLHTADGRRIIDAISSWWVVTHGHCHPPIVRAIQEQAGKLDQIIFAGYTHDPAEEVAARLLRLAPRGLDYVFFSDSGSASVEVAIKMALGYWHHSRKERTRIVVMQHSYHGDTVGAMSVGARGVFNAAYGPLLFDVTSIPFPAKGRERETLNALASACQNERPAAFIVEPLILGAGGMLMYPSWVLREMKRICEVSDILFIADEIMTGWGRTGTLFACEHANVTPDIVCYSKGITGGALPLAVTLCREEIFEAHYSSDRTRTFFHSSSYTANPVACAAAKANLELWEVPETRGRVTSVAAMQEEAIEPFRADTRFENVRRTGTITALDLKVDDAGYLAGIGPKLYSFFKDRNLLLRPLGNTIYVMPPYCVTAADLDEIYAGIRDAADAVDGLCVSGG